MAAGQGFVYRDPPTKELIISHYLSPVLSFAPNSAPGPGPGRVSHSSEQDGTAGHSYAVTLS